MIQIHETQKFPSRYNPKKSSPRYTIIKLSKVKDKEQNSKIKLHIIESLLDYQRISQEKPCSQQRMGLYAQSAKRKQLSAKNTIPSKTVLHK
jgi:hypothetical protein